MAHQDWLRIIAETYQLGCRSCQFIGGEPFLYKGRGKETVLDLAEHAVNIGYSDVELFTNATLLTKAEVQQIKNLGLNIAVSLYSNDAQIHDKITGRLGSFEKTMRTLVLLKDADIPTRVEIVIMKTNQRVVEPTMGLVSDLGFDHKQPDIIRPSGRGTNVVLKPNPEILARYGLMNEPNFSVNLETFVLFCNTNSCLFGKIGINNNGDVYPCIFSGDYLFGNFVETKALQSIIEGKTAQTVWLNTKDHVQVCKDCEYRYTCEDCRPLAAACAGEDASFLDSPPPRCTYNPYTGEWGRGTWKLNRATRKPFYDRSLEPVIQRVLAG